MTGRPRSTEPKRTDVIKILVTPELDALVTAAAKREGRSVSDWGQRLFEKEVSHRAAPRKRKRCPDCNQLLYILNDDGSIEPHMRLASFGGNPVLCTPATTARVAPGRARRSRR